MPYDQKILIKCSLSEEPWNGSNWGNWRNMTNQWWSKTVKHVTNGERNKTTYLTNTGIKHHNDCKKGQVAWETWMDSWGLGRSWARGQILLGRGKVGGIFGTEDVCDAYRAVGDWPLVRGKKTVERGGPQAAWSSGPLVVPITVIACGVYESLEEPQKLPIMPNVVKEQSRVCFYSGMKQS